MAKFPKLLGKDKCMLLMEIDYKSKKNSVMNIGIES